MRDAGELVAQAEDELAMAKEALKSRGFEWALSRSKLSVLSILKALLLFKGAQYRSNTIPGLLNELNQVTILPNDTHSAAMAVNNDYPLPSEKICRFVVQQADVVLGWVLREMGWQG